MAARNPARRSLAASVSALERHRPGSVATLQARAELAVAGLEEHIAEVVDQAPPLSPEQRVRLAQILFSGTP